MDGSPLYLRQDVQLEPLFDQWYAWSYLLPPATAARNIAERHLKIMDSYIAAPQVHASAARNPKFLGGPFIDYGGQRVDEIRALRDRTKRERAAMLELSDALVALDELLRDQAKGFSLDPLYRRVPEILRGYVELVYDLNNQPSFRLIEPLLYRSSYYDRSAQSLMLSFIQSDDRPFVLSTPRLESDSSVHLRMPFDAPAVDDLFRLKTSPRCWSCIRSGVPVPEPAEELFRSLFTEDPPPPYRPYEGTGVRWRYFGHACILVESKGISILLDPVLSYTYEHGISRYTYLDLPDVIDYVLITHNHQDHVLLETLLQIRHKTRHVVVPRNGGGKLQDPSLKLSLANAGFSGIIELDELEELRTPAGSILGIPFLGEHSDLDVRTKLGYLVRFGRHSLLFAADSRNIEPELYRMVGREVGAVDVLFLGMECDGAPLSWLYGPLLSRRIERGMDESRRLAGSDFEQAQAMASALGCKDAYVYAMGQEPWLNHVMSLKYTEMSRPIVEANKFIAAWHERGLTAERLYGEKEILLDG